MAAGLTVRPDKLDGLRLRLNELARRVLSAEQLRPSLRIDMEISLSELTPERVDELAGLEPVGQGNPPVHLLARCVRHQRPPQAVGKEKQHLKLWLTDGTATHEAVWWNGAAKPGLEGPFDLAFAPQINEFNGRRIVQLKVLDWRRA